MSDDKGPRQRPMSNPWPSARYLSNPWNTMPNFLNLLTKRCNWVKFYYVRTLITMILLASTRSYLVVIGPFFIKMVARGHFGWTNITSYCIAHHFKSIEFCVRNGYPAIFFTKWFTMPILDDQNHFLSHFSPFQINAIKSIRDEGNIDFLSRNFELLSQNFELWKSTFRLNKV